jgi:hypothetical protein
VAEREHLDPADVLQVVGDRLEVAVVREPDGDRVLHGVRDVVHACAEAAQPPLDLGTMAHEPVVQLEVGRAVAVGEGGTHHVAVRRRAVERVARRVRPAVLHRLEHARQVPPDRAGAVAVDEAGYPAHGLYGSTSRYSSRSQSVTAAR